MKQERLVSHRVSLMYVLAKNSLARLDEFQSGHPSTGVEIHVHTASGIAIWVNTGQCFNLCGVAK